MAESDPHIQLERRLEIAGPAEASVKRKSRAWGIVLMLSVSICPLVFRRWRVIWARPLAYQ